MTTSSIDVSVIIPVYNGEQYIETAIESVLSQTNCSFELLVINDGSTDQTSLAVAPYRSRLRYFEQENQGVSVARNLGIEQARGQYLAFLDADDYFLTDKLSEQLKIFQNDPEIGLVHSGWQRVDSQGHKLSEVCPWQAFPQLDLLTWLQHKPILPSAMMFERCWLQKVGGFDPQLAAAEDVDLVLRLAIEGCRSKWLPKVTTAYRQHEKSAMGNSQTQAQCLEIMLDKVFNHPKIPSEALLVENKVRYGTLIWAAWYLHRNGQLEGMASRLLQAYKLAPQLPTIAITEWVESFRKFSRNLGEELPVGHLVGSTQWKKLQSGLLNHQASHSR